MREIAAKAYSSPRTFKISNFEPNALYVPSHALLEHPAPNDFLILEPHFIITDLTPVKAIHADVMPQNISWEAYDLNETFKLTTAALDRRLLEAIARGHIFPPNTSRHALLRSRTLVNSLFDMDKDWNTTL
jgi:hypothetical protein